MLRKNAEQRAVVVQVPRPRARPMPPKPSSGPGVGCAITLLSLVGVSAFVYRGCLSNDPDARPSVALVDLGDLAPNETRSLPASVSGHVSSSAFGEGCRGTFERAPTFRIRVREASMVTLATKNGESDDRTMALRARDGTWYCDDDSGGAMNPQLRLALGPGEYPVWVGIYSDDTMSTSFTFTVRAEPVPGMVPPGVVAGGAGGARRTLTASQLGAAPTGGVDAIPHEAGRLDSQGIAGGAFDVSSLGPGCRGYVPLAPQRSFTLSEPQDLAFATTNSSDADLVMLVRSSDGRILCDDDSGEDQNPRIAGSFPAGRVDVWVGALHDDVTTVYVMGVDHETAPTGAMDHGLAIESESRLGTLVPESSALPYRGDASVSGRVDSTGLGGGCHGALSVASTLTLEVRAPTPLSIYTESTTDLVMAVRHPDGTWACNDDAIGNQPRVRETFAPGVHRVWIGTYSADESATFTLHVDAE